MYVTIYVLVDMEWWSKMTVPVRKVWFGVSKRLGIRKTGLLKLRHDVRTCEYEDVHVLWNLLNKNESGFARSTLRSKRGRNWNLCSWAKRSPFFYRSV